jgi:phosphate transport system protein
MTADHIIKSFDDELNQLENVIAEMGGLCELQLADAIDAIVKRDPEKAEKVIMRDDRIDALERKVDQQAIRLLALRQPMADDLRAVITALKTASILERVGDYSKNIARRTVALSKAPTMSAVKTIVRMGGLVQAMIKNVLDAYIERDLKKADAVLKGDGDVDLLYTSLFRELLTYMMEDPRNITPSTHLLFIAKIIERIGDHATNIANNVHFMVRGMEAGERQKGEGSIFLPDEDLAPNRQKDPAD